MNIFYIFAFIIIVMMTPEYINAQENLLKNGDFEDTNFTLFKYESIENCPNIKRMGYMENGGRMDGKRLQ